MSTDIDKIFAVTKGVMGVIHRAGLLPEFESLREKRSALEVFQELARRHPELSSELDTEAFAS